MQILDHTIDLLTVRDADPGRFPFLLESHSDGDGRHRYDMLLEASDEYLALTAGGVEFRTSESSSGVPAGHDADNFLAQLQAWFRREQRQSGCDPATAFHGGWFLYLGYELSAQIERGLVLPAAPDELPIALAVRCRNAVIVDHHLQRTLVAGEDRDPQRLRELADFVRHAHGEPAPTATGTSKHSRPLARDLQVEPGENYRASVERIRDYIAAGDVFQVNLSRRWDAQLCEGVDATAVHRALRQHNPSPFAALMEWRGSTVVSSSPERLVRVSGGIAETRPIAGTRPRGDDTAADQKLAEELLKHYKERAEHIMLIDLERNDLGRVCEPGSIEVDELMSLESYSHVHHIVSNIRGRLRPDATAIDAIAATFPGGTITGCPKVRCMEIIAELEGRGRGPYTGSLGYLDVCGRMDLNILIRSMVIENGHAAFNAGAGIVADSDPIAELRETGHKARGLLRALGLDEQPLG